MPKNTSDNANVVPCSFTSIVPTSTSAAIAIAPRPTWRHCLPSGGVFALNAFAKDAGRIYLFFSYDQPGREVYMQRWLGKLLDSVSFDV